MSGTPGTWVSVAKASELASGALKRVEIGGQELAVFAVAGTYYALADRCGHMSAPLSRGALAATPTGLVITCPLHGSRFDGATGKNLSGPVKEAPPDLDQATDRLRRFLARTAELSAAIRTHDVPRFDIRTVGDDVQVRL